MRIPDWSADLKPQPQDLIDAVLKRRGGKLIELDHVLMWSEPIAPVRWATQRIPSSRSLRLVGRPVRTAPM